MTVAGSVSAYGAIEFSKAWVAVEIAGTMRQWSGCLEA
jgi:hypothetical protein|tara:strand:+ start:1670 stop:1783 length:114 start_codon:yes stop_codon:yes gene_type:complete